MGNDKKVAYFSMEIAILQGIPTYSGGLGVLAGDMIRSAADAKVPMIGVTLLDRKGYFDQKLDPSGRQTEEPASWAIGDRASIGAERDFRTADAAALYDKLENVVLPTFYRDRDRFLNIMLHSIALNGLFFNTQRMIEQYCLRAYFV